MIRSFVILTVCTLLASGAAMGDQWYVEFVDSLYIVEGTSIAVDSYDNVHISFSDVNSMNEGTLRYGYWNGSDWTLSDVLTGYDTGCNSIALDSSDMPSIAFWIADLQVIMWAYWGGSYWNTCVVDWNTDAAGNIVSLCMDSGDMPHIAYIDTDPDSCVRYAVSNGSTFDLYTIDTNMGTHVSMALDDSDTPHVAYLTFWDWNLGYAVLNGGNWYLTDVDTSVDTGWYTSIDTDSNGNPHISYYDEIAQCLMYAHHDGSTWHTEVVDDSGDMGQVSTSLVIDGSDNPHIAYFDTINSRLMYARHSGSGWDIAVVDDDGYVGLELSMALDSQDRPRIVYFEFPTSNGGWLKFARWESTSIEGGSTQECTCSLSVSPNPCREMSAAAFTLPVSGNASLGVYDMTGRRIASLADGYLEAGHHTASVSGLGGGVYFLRLDSPAGTVSTRLVVLE